jgi:hypothetical protein
MWELGRILELVVHCSGLEIRLGSLLLTLNYRAGEFDLDSRRLCGKAYGHFGRLHEILELFRSVRSICF